MQCDERQSQQPFDDINGEYNNFFSLVFFLLSGFRVMPMSRCACRLMVFFFSHTSISINWFTIVETQTHSMYISKQCARNVNFGNRIGTKAITIYSEVVHYHIVLDLVFLFNSVCLYAIWQSSKSVNKNIQLAVQVSDRTVCRIFVVFVRNVDTIFSCIWNTYI